MLVDWRNTMPVAKAVADVLNNDLSRAVVAVLCVLGTFALLLTDRQVPPEVWVLDTMAFTFFFSAVVAKAAR